MSAVIEIVVTPQGDTPVDITDHVIFSTARFQGQLSAIPGVMEMTVRDMDQDQLFIIGSEVTLTIDGTRQWGGFLTQVSMTYAFPADDTSDSPTYQNRYWVLAGVDFNILFDKLVLRNTSNYLAQPPRLSGGTMDGAALIYMLEHYADIPAGFDTSTFMDDITTVSADGTSPWAFVQQGSKLRDQFDQLALRSAASYYIDANKNFHWHAIETLQSVWGFSDQPNFTPITAGSEFSNAYYGFREVEALEDGSGLINDALIWGGSEFAGASGGTVFARTEDATSEETYGRWQTGEVHIGEEGFGIQAGVDARANAIVTGPPGADAYGQLKGLRYSQWQFRCVWHDKDVPLITGVPDHLRAGQLVTLDLQVFEVNRLLPLRTLTITFPDQEDETGTYVRFEGDFGIQLSDPFTLWAAILKNQKDPIIRPSTGPPIVVPTDPTSPTGGHGQFHALPDPDGSTTVFTFPVGYIANSSQVYLVDPTNGGTLMRRGVDYEESDPAAGEITWLVTPPDVGFQIWAVLRTISGSVTPPPDAPACVAQFTATGGDDTAALAAFLESHAHMSVCLSGDIQLASVCTVEIPAGATTSWTWLPGAKLTSINPDVNSSDCAILRLIRPHNLVLYSPVIEGTGYYWDPLGVDTGNAFAQAESGLELYGGADVTVYDPLIYNTRGDGIYTGSGAGGVSDGEAISNLVIYRPNLHHNSRNNITGNNGQVTMIGPGTLDHAGLSNIDLEPNNGPDAGTIVFSASDLRCTNHSDLPVHNGTDTGKINGQTLGACGSLDQRKPYISLQGISADIFEYAVQHITEIHVNGCDSDTPVDGSVSDLDFYYDVSSVDISGNTDIVLYEYPYCA